MIYTNRNHIPDVSVTEGSLLKRVVVFLEDGEFDRADEYCERVLDINVENGDAYFYKLLASLRLRSKNDLYDLEAPIDTEPSYAKIMRFGTPEQKREIESINTAILKATEEKRKAACFESAFNQLQSESIPVLTKAFSALVSLRDFPDASEYAEKCRSKIEGIYDNRYNELYLAAKQTEQQISDIKFKNESREAEKTEYEQFVTANRGRKVFDYSFIVAAFVGLVGILIVFFLSSNYLTAEGITFRSVLICILTRIIPGMPLTGISCLISLRIAKQLIKKQKANLFEDINEASRKARRLAESIEYSVEEILALRRELEDRLAAVQQLNDEYDLFLAEKESAASAQGNQ